MNLLSINEISQVSGGITKNLAKNSDGHRLKGGGPCSTTPKYLYIKDFKKCLGTTQKGGMFLYCLPNEKPESCPENSWEDLKNYKDCRENPIITCEL